MPSSARPPDACVRGAGVRVAVPDAEDRPRLADALSRPPRNGRGECRQQQQQHRRRRRAQPEVDFLKTIWARAGHFRYFDIFSIIKNEFFAFFIKLINYFCTSPI